MSAQILCQAGINRDELHYMRCTASTWCVSSPGFEWARLYLIASTEATRATVTPKKEEGQKKYDRVWGAAGAWLPGVRTCA